MFGVSFTEILIVLAAALVLLGPEKLPEAAKSLGRFMAMIKRNSDALRREFYNTIYEPAEDLKNRIDLSARELISLEMPDDPENMNCEQKAKLDSEQIQKEKPESQANEKDNESAE